MSVSGAWGLGTDNGKLENSGESLEYRCKLFVMGDLGSGKTSLVQSLIGESVRTVEQPTEGVTVDTWFPFESDERGTNGNGVTGKENLAVDIWDLCGRQVCQVAHQSYMTKGALYVIVFNVVDQTSCDSVLNYIHLIQTKCPGSAVLLVATKIDKISSAEKLLIKQNEIIKMVLGTEARLIDNIQEELYKLKLCNICGKIQEQIDYYDNALKTRPKLADSIMEISCSSGKGVEKLRKTLLAKLLDQKLFPLHGYSVGHEVWILKDKITKLKNAGTVLVSWTDFKVYCDELENLFQDENAVKEYLNFLEISGSIVRYELGEGNEMDSLILCVNPRALAHAICCMLVDDDKKSFRIEAGRFWPKSSKCTTPDPGLLVRALEDIPLRGLAREILFPILWQDTKLNESQVRIMLQLMENLDLLHSSDDCRVGLSELCMPYFPRLSTEGAFYLPLLGLMKTGKPQLNWMPKPLKDDVQIVWHFEFSGSILPGFFRLMLTRCKRVATKHSNYQHLWNNGLLTKIDESWVHVSFEGNSFDIIARVNEEEGDDVFGSIDLCWVLLATFLHPLLEFLRRYPGLIYKIYLSPYGELFFNGTRRESSSYFPLNECLSKLTGGDVFNFTDINGTGELDLTTLIRFTDTPDQNLSAWIRHICCQQTTVLPKVLPKITKPLTQTKLKSSKKKGLLVTWNLNNNSAENSISATNGSIINNKRDGVKSVKSGLPVISIETSDGTTEMNRQNGQDSANRFSQTKCNKTFLSVNHQEALSPQPHEHKNENMVAQTGNDERYQAKMLSEDEEIKAASKIASAFVAAILAKAVAEYIELAYEDNHQRTHRVTEAQVTAAKIAAEAATATQMGNVDGAAIAVLHAAEGIRAVMEKGSLKGSELSNAKSKTCNIL